MRERMIEELKKLGIETAEQLNEAIDKQKPLDITLMVGGRNDT